MKRLAGIAGAASLAILAGRFGSPGIAAAIVATVLYWRALEAA